jgi:hypothetical protein
VFGALRPPRRFTRRITAGRKSAINTAMIAISTKSSISVNPARCPHAHWFFSSVISIE